MFLLNFNRFHNYYNQIICFFFVFVVVILSFFLSFYFICLNKVMPIFNTINTKSLVQG